MAYNARKAKAAQTITFFAMKNDEQPLDIVKAVKLVYLADRESVSRFGFPIQDEDRVSMKYGPVNSDTHAMINGEGDLTGSGWAEFLRDREDHRLSLVNPALSADDFDELSDADLDVLDATRGRFGGMQTWDLVAWTHDPKNVPEWEHSGSTSWLIPLEVMMGHLGVPNVAEQAATVRDFDRIDTLFRTL